MEFSLKVKSYCNFRKSIVCLYKVVKVSNQIAQKFSIFLYTGIYWYTHILLGSWNNRSVNKELMAKCSFQFAASAVL